MPKCQACKDDVDELHPVRVAGRNKRLCEECAEVVAEEQQIAEESESVIQGMMEYGGRR